MCLIISKPAGVELNLDLVAQSVADNRDGWGVMYADHFGLHIKRGMDAKDYNDFAATISAETSVVLHTRIGTSGTKTIDNCHPFRIGRDFALMHNGIISIDRPEKDFSDTWHFVRDVVGPMLERRPQLFGSEALKMLLSRVIGGSKLVLMNKDGEVMIVNESAGRWYKGMWVSNERSLYGYHWKDRADHWKFDPAYPGDKEKENATPSYNNNYYGQGYQHHTGANYAPNQANYAGTSYQQAQAFAKNRTVYSSTDRDYPRWSKALDRMVWPHEASWTFLPETPAVEAARIVSGEKNVYTPEVPITNKPSPNVALEALITNVLTAGDETPTEEKALISAMSTVEQDGTVVPCLVN